MKERVCSAVRVVGEFTRAVETHKVGLVAAGLTFYVVFALVPAVIAFGLFASVVLDPADLADVGGNVAATLGSVTGKGTDETVWEPLARLSTHTIGLFTISGVLAVLVALFSASRVVVTIRQALDVTFAVPQERQGWLLRLTAAVVALVALLTMAAVTVAVLVIPRVLTEMTGEPVRFGNTGWNWLLGFLAIAAGSKLLYQYGPHTLKRTRRPRVPWTTVGIWATSGWTLTASATLGWLIEWSTGTMSTILIFGSPVIVMTWLYVLFLGMFLGAELTALQNRLPATPKGTRKTPCGPSRDRQQQACRFTGRE